MPDEDNTANLIALGHPIHLFIDTSTLERMHFPFGQPRLKPLMDRLEAGDIKLLIPDVISREIHEHVAKRVTEAERIFSKFRRVSSITKIAEGIPDVAPDIDWEAAKAAVTTAISRFFEGHGVELLEIDGEDTASVFDDYFARRPPFGKDKKKSEFPDSFAIKSLLRFAAENECRIAVISEDPDWTAACEANEEFIGSNSLDQLVEYSQVALSEVYEELKRLLEPHRTKLEQAVLVSFRDRGLFWESFEGHDSDVEETYDEVIESWPWSVIAIDDGWAFLTGEAEFRFRATASYPDPDSCFRDSDTKEFIFFGTKRATLVATTHCQISLGFDVDELRAGRLVSEDLQLDLGDVWFSEEEIEAISDDRDREE